MDPSSVNNILQPFKTKETIKKQYECTVCNKMVTELKKHMTAHKDLNSNDRQQEINNSKMADKNHVKNGFNMKVERFLNKSDTIYSQNNLCRKKR